MSAHSGPEIAEDGLVLCLDAANRKSYTGTGSIWYDAVGTNSANLINGGTYSSDSSGAIVLDGIDDYIEMNQNLQLGSDFTISLTFKQTAARGDWVRLFGHSNDTTNRYWGLWLPAGSNTLLWQSYKNGGQINVGYTFNLNQTYTIDFTSVGAARVMYVNGISISSVSDGGVIDYTGNTSKIRLGNAGFHATHVGNFYNARIYNRALTASEIQRNFNALRGRFGV